MLDLEKLEKEGLYIKYDNYLQAVEDSNWEGTKHKGCKRASQNTNGPGWIGTKNFEEAYNLAIGGWKEGIDDNFNDNSILEQAEYKNIIECVNDVYGSYVDMGRYLTGEPKCMVIPVINKTPKSLKIICKIGFNGSASTSEIFDYGQNIVKIIDYCEKENIRVELVARSITENNDKYLIQDFILKRYGEFLDKNKIVFPLCHASFQRRIIFSLKENLSREVVRAFGFHDGSHYGRSTSLQLTEEEKEKSLIIEPEHSGSFESSDEFLINTRNKIIKLTKQKTANE